MGIQLMEEQIQALLPASTKYRVFAEIRDNPQMSLGDIARKLGMSQTTVSRHIRGMVRDNVMDVNMLPAVTARGMADHEAQDVISRSGINVMDQLADSNDAMWNLIERIEKQVESRGDGVMTAGEISAYTRAMGEIRQQLTLQTQLVEMMVRLDTVKEFQKVVTDTINEIDPQVGQLIRKKLIEKRAMRSAVTL
jgi:DNA-binding Lrp family transcriptional regulator